MRSSEARVGRSLDAVVIFLEVDARKRVERMETMSVCGTKALPAARKTRRLATKSVTSCVSSGKRGGVEGGVVCQFRQQKRMEGEQVGKKTPRTVKSTL